MIRRSFPRSLAILAVAAGFLLLGPASAASAATATTTPSAAAPARATAVKTDVDVDNFSYSSWDSTFEVDIDDDGRATLHVEERVVAEFPDYDQNRGIVRGIPETYRGAGIDTRVLSVRDENGADVPFETEEDDGLIYILTGTDDYVHGATTYVIEYEMRDVILAATQTQVDEFFWDLLPLDSTQPIEEFHADIVFDEKLSAHLTGNAACYIGAQGSTATCEKNAVEFRADGNTFTVSATDLPAGDGITVAIALDAGTVTQPSSRLPNPTTDVLPYALGGGAAALSIGGWFATRAMIRSRRQGTGIVVAQFDVPDDMPPLLAAAILPSAKNPIAAEIVHLAVRGLLRIEELAGDNGKSKQPRLRKLAGARAPDPLDEQALKALFPNADAGVVKVPKSSEGFAARMQTLVSAGTKAAEQRELTTKARSRAALVIQIIALTTFLITAGLLVWAMVTGRASAGPVFLVTILSGIVVLIATSFAFTKHKVLTRDGALSLEYLEGVREFIRVAEADRLRMLQSYSGADRRRDGSVDVVHLYERLLPYAILFGQEREWGEVLGAAYNREQRSAGWLDGASDVGIYTRIALFSAATQSAATYSAPSTGSSSSAGGSMGGGFSGGGGGGGFSGGR